MVEFPTPPQRKSLHERTVKFVKNTSERALLEVARKLSVGSLVYFKKTDSNLQLLLNSLSANALNLIKTENVPLYEASTQAIEDMMTKHFRNKRPAEIFASSIVGAISAIIPHSLSDRFQANVYPSCIDYALLNHLLMEKLGISGSKVVAFIDSEGFPTFALKYEDKILTYEELGWIPLKNFARARRIGGRDERVFDVYPLGNPKLKKTTANFTNLSLLKNVIRKKKGN